MKKYILPLIVIALLIATVSPAFAFSGVDTSHSHDVTPPPFSLAGTITAINGSTVTVKVAAGNTLVKNYIGKNLPIVTTSKTVFLKTDGTTTVKITLADLAIGQKVSVLGVVSGTTFTAYRITVGAKLVGQS